MFEDKFSTERRRRVARGVKFEMLFADRSSLSKFTHSPMHPRSCIPKDKQHKCKYGFVIIELINKHFLKSYQDLSVWETISIPNQTLLYATWAALQLSSHSLHLEESEWQERISHYFYSYACSESAHGEKKGEMDKKKECWKHNVFC